MSAFGGVAPSEPGAPISSGSRGGRRDPDGRGARTCPSLPMIPPEVITSLKPEPTAVFRAKVRVRLRVAAS